jgi:hypothetical protein
MSKPVKFRDCACPGTPHTDGDTVTFRDQLDFSANARAVGLIFSGEGEPNSTKAWPVYLHEGPIAWNLLDEDGEPVLLTRDALDALEFADQYEIADRADDIYRDTVLAPLVRRMNALSKAGPTPKLTPIRSSASPTRSTASGTARGR